jgi:predicted site-specific integrase-resolvase
LQVNGKDGDKMKFLYDLEEASKAVGIRPRTLRFYIHRGDIIAKRGPRGRILIPNEELEKIIKNLPTVTKRGVSTMEDV